MSCWRDLISEWRGKEPLMGRGKSLPLMQTLIQSRHICFISIYYAFQVHFLYFFRFLWERTFLAESQATVEWKVPLDQEVGVYRITHLGHFKTLGNLNPIPFRGKTRKFKVIYPFKKSSYCNCSNVICHYRSSQIHYSQEKSNLHY